MFSAKTRVVIFATSFAVFYLFVRIWKSRVLSTLLIQPVMFNCFRSFQPLTSIAIGLHSVYPRLILYPSKVMYYSTSSQLTFIPPEWPILGDLCKNWRGKG